MEITMSDTPSLADLEKENEMELGIHEDLTLEDYHAAAGISKSGLHLLRRSPRHYWERYLNPDRKPVKPTPIMDAGTAIHCAVLEPERFHATYLQGPCNDARLKIWKEKAAQAQEEGKILLKQDAYEDIIDLAAEVAMHPIAGKLLKVGKAEQSLFWKEEGVLCKTRPDWISPDVLVDLKTTDDARAYAFTGTAYRFGYHIQAAMGLRGFAAQESRMLEFHFVVVERERPFAVKVYRPSDAFLQCGVQDFMEALDLYNKCLGVGEWPSYSAEVEELELPAWALPKEKP